MPNKGKPDKPPGKPEKPPVIIVVPPPTEPPVIINPPTVESHQLTGQRAIPMVGILTPGQSLAVATSSTRATATTAVGALAPSGGGGTPTPTPTPEDDFILRRMSPGVIRWNDFNTLAALGGTVSQFESDPFYQQGEVRIGPSGTPPTPMNWPTLDTAVKASGAGSLRFDIPSSAVTYDDMMNPAGYWSCNFTPSVNGFPNPYIPFGNNSAFFVQFRVRWNQAMCDRIFTHIGGGHAPGVKLFDIVSGDHNGQSYSTSSKNKLVIQTFYQGKALQIYRYPGDRGLWARPGGQYLIQQGDYSTCIWPDATSDPPLFTSSCFSMLPNQWITFQIGVTLGNPGTYDWGGDDGVQPVWLNSTVKLWATHEGQATKLIVDWNPSTVGYQPLLRWPAVAPDTGDQQYGRVNLFPYMTQVAGPQPAGGAGQVWYDELIISASRIPDPASSSGGTGNAILTALAANTLMALPDVSATVPGEDPLLVNGMGVFSPLVYDPTRYRVFLRGGGHIGTNYDGCLFLDLATLTWMEDYRSGSAADFSQWQTRFDRTRGVWLSGSGTGPYPRPAARHVEDMMHVVGDELILLAKIEGNGVSGISPPYPDTPETADEFFLATFGRCGHYNMTTKTWTFSPTAAGFTSYPGQAYDPVSGKIISLGELGLESYDPATMTRAMHINLGTYAGMDRMRDEAGNNLSSSPPDRMGYNNSLHYWPGDQKFYYFEHFSGKVWRIDLDRSNFDNSWLTRLDTVVGTPPPSAYEVGFAFDTLHNVFVGALINNVIYVFSPETKAWSHQNVLGGVPGVTMSSQCIAYDTRANCFIINQTYNGATYAKMWAYKYIP